MNRLNWTTCALADCSEIIRGVSFPSQAKRLTPSTGSIACLRTANVQKEVDWSDLWFVPREYVRREEQVLKCLDILISLANSWELVGKTALVRNVPLPSTLGAFISAIRCRDAINPKFIFYQLTSPLKIAELRDLASTTTNISNISTAKLARLPLSLAPAGEQDRIVEKLEELLSDLDASTVALDRARANLKRYRAAVLKAAVEGKLTAEWRKSNPLSEPADKLLERILVERRKKWEEAQLSKYVEQGKQPPKGWKDSYVQPVGPAQDLSAELPTSWCWTTIAQTSKVQGGIQKQPKRAPASNAFPYLRVANVLRNRLDLRQIEYFELFEGELARFRLECGDMLVVEGNGSRSEIGRSAIWRSEIENCVHQNHLIRVRFEAGIPEYLNAYWNSPLGNRNVMAKAASTSGLYTLSTQKLSELPLPLPPIEEQRQIVKEVEAHLSTIAHAEIEICSGMARATRLRQAILKRAFEGKLVPQDPHDEPASVLLERIRAARASDPSFGERSRKREGNEEQRQRSIASTKPAKRGKKKPKRDLFAELSEGFDSLKRERDV